MATLKRSVTEAGFDFTGNPAVTEPFGVGRSTARLLFDFAVMVSRLKPELRAAPVLDFGAGTGWITEWLARMGWSVVAFDVHGDLGGCLQHRLNADLRVPSELISFEHGDGHSMPFADGSFGHVLCYDTLHHMHDYERVFAEFSRVLRPGGRAIFVEPGALHGQSPETIAFLALKADDPTWIERSVVLEEIDAVARRAGLSGLTIVPSPHPEQPVTFSLAEWLAYRAGSAPQRERLANDLATMNYNNRVVFYCEK